jgi:hypothetical protein
MLIVYIVEVFASSTVATFGFDGYTHSFFASGYTGCSSGCFIVPVVALVIFSLGYP